jgi:hypothetical protein
MSTPEIRIDPFVEAVIELFNLIIDEAVTDFPEPLSPTMPRVSPL